MSLLKVRARYRAFIAVAIASLMLFGAISTVPNVAEAQVEDARFVGTITVGGLPSDETLVMYAIGMEDTPSGNSTVTDASGDYEIWVEGGYTYTVYFANGAAMFDNNAVSEQYINPGQTIVIDANLTPAPPRNVTIMGYVTNASNPSEPITNCHVLGIHMDIFSGGDDPDYINWSVPNGTGYYEVTLIEGAVSAAVFDAPGYMPGMPDMQSPLILSDGESGWVNISLMPLSALNITVTGNVTDTVSMTPIEGALVEVELYDIWYSDRNNTNASGGYILQVMEGEGRMRASANGYTTYEEYDILFQNNMTKDFQLIPNNARVHGYILDDLTLAPISNASVRAYQWIGPGQELSNETLSGSDGYYEMNLSDGGWDLWAEADAYADNWTWVWLNPSDNIEANISLAPENCIFKGYVLDNTTAAPIENVRVNIQGWNSDNSTLTNASGYYEMYCAPDDYEFMFFPPSGYSIEIQVFGSYTINQSETVWVNHTLKETTTEFYGTATDNVTAAPLSGVQINIAHMVPNSSFIRYAFGTTDQNGNYSFMVVFDPNSFFGAYLTDYKDNETMINIANISRFAFNFTMDPIIPPEVTAHADPDSNISIMNHADLWAEVVENELNFFEQRLCNIVDIDSQYAYLEILEWFWFDPGNPMGSSLNGTEVASGVWEIGLYDWDSNYSFGGGLLALYDSPGEHIKTQNWWYDGFMDEYNVWNGWYDNSTLGGPVPIMNAIFDGTSGNLISLDLGFGQETDPVIDPTGTYWQDVWVHQYNLQTNEIDSWWIMMNSATLSTSSMYIENVRGPPAYPSGDYAAWFTADDGWEWTYNISLFQVDNTFPIADAGPDQTVDEDTLVTFDGSNSADNIGIVSYTWTFDDGGRQTLTGMNPTYLFATPGVYLVLLNVSDAANLWSTDIMRVTVNDTTSPTADAGPDQTVDEGTLVTFDGSASTDNVAIVNYTWTFTDGGPQTLYGVIRTYTFVTPGIYIVTLNVTDNEGQWDTDDVSITVLDITPPVADAGSDQTVDEDTLVTFDGSASSDNVGIVNYTWTFDDGGTQTLYEESPTYIFATPGIYDVTLNVSDAAGLYDTDNMTVTVNDTTPPTAVAGNDLWVNPDTIVTFDGSGSSDNVGIINYTWTFVDVTPQTLYGENPSYNFTNIGAFDVTLNVTDDAGHSDEDNVMITVVTDTTPPTADAGPDQTVDEDTLVTFDGSGSTDNVGIGNYTWTFMDGTPQTLYGVNPTYIFATPDIYTVTLNVTDLMGLSALDTVTITVIDVTDPVADAGPDDTDDEDALVTFDGSGSTDNVGVVNYTWTFSDGAAKTLYGIGPSYTFATPGTYEVILNVSDAEGNYDEDNVTITILDVTDPVADAGADQTVEEGDSVDFDGNNSTDNAGIANYTWTFTDGGAQTLYGVSPSYTFDNAGTYEVTLRVTDDAGLNDTDTVTITVEEVTAGPTADAGDDQTVDEGTSVLFDGSDSIGAVNFTWTFTYDDETQTLYGVAPIFEFEIAGTYEVTLTVRDTANNTDTDTVEIIVNEVEEEGGVSFLNDYWWILIVIIIIAVAAIASVILRRGKGGKPSPAPAAKESGEELPPPPPPED